MTSTILLLSKENSSGSSIIGVDESWYPWHSVIRKKKPQDLDDTDMYTTSTISV